MPKWTPEQQEAIDREGTNIIVSAGAGSGKTAVLTERVLRKLRNGVNINQLLILTFTKAAAAEMKERIRKGIKKEPSLSSELDYLDSAYITTFDSYALSVVKKYHYLLNVSKSLKIIDGSTIEVEKRKLIDSIFRERYEREDPLFLKMIGELCVKDDTEMQDTLFKIASKIDLLPNRESFIDHYLEYYFNEEYLKKTIEKYLQFLKRKKENLHLELEHFAVNVDGTYYEKVENVLLPLFSSETYEEMKNNSILKLPPLPRGSEEEAKRAKETLNKAITEFHSYCSYADLEEIETTLLKTKDYVVVFLDLLKDFMKRVADYKLEKDAYEFQDITLMAIQLVQDFPSVRQELSSSFKEIMIDEYQDTNDLQETFISKISNHNVYMVGDIKQSIYRFRNANPNLFKEKYRKYSNLIDGVKIDLNKNFRSRKEVLENINLLFDYLMDEEIGGAEYRESHEMIFGNNTYLEKGFTKQNYNLEVYQYPYEKGSFYSKEEIEAFLIAHDIKKRVESHEQIFDKDLGILRDITYQDFAILMDRTTNFSLYKKIFLFEQIPLTLYQDESITSEMDMYVLKNLLTLILKIKERDFGSTFQYCFTSIARSFLFSYSDSEIVKHLENHTVYQTELFQKAEKIAKKLDYLSNRELLEQVIDDFSFYESYITIGNIESSMVRIDYLFDLATNLGQLGMSPNDFIPYFGDLIKENYDIRFSLNTDNDDSVKIMTIHKSKGLEFPICYYSGLYKTFNLSDLKDRFLFDLEFGIIAPYFEEGIGTTIYKDLLKERFLEEEIAEKIRLFYVALTRAKEKMIFVTSLEELPSLEKENGVIRNQVRLSYRSFQDMLTSLSPLLSPYITSFTLDEIGLTHDYKLRKNEDILKYIPISEETFLYRTLDYQKEEEKVTHYSKTLKQVLTKEEKKQIDLGNHLHEQLEYFDFQNPVIDHFPSFEQSILNRLLKSEPLQNYEKATIYQEYEFYDNEENKHGVIDLLLVFKDHVRVIDYKLKNLDDDAYQKQLRGYQKFIEKKLNRPVQLYLYSLLEGTYLQL